MKSAYDKVSDVEFIIEDKDNNDGNVISWLKVPGEGTFVVDLKAGEYVVDNESVYCKIKQMREHMSW